MIAVKIMIINSVQSNNYNSKFSFTGNVKRTPLYVNYALKYAKKIDVSSNDWSKLKLFINIIRAVKRDGTNNVLVLDTVQKNNKTYWQISYGNYTNTNGVYNPVNYNLLKHSEEKIQKDAFNKILEFGKEYFGIRMLTKPINEFSSINKYLKRANLFLSKSHEPQNKSVAKRLETKAHKEILKCGLLLEEPRMEVFKDL